MADRQATVASLRDQVANFVQERDWEQFHTPKDLAAAITIEAAELLEIFLWKQEAEAVDLQHVREELADVLILCMSLANRIDIDVSEAVLHKLESNAKKYPAETIRGKAHKYTHYS
jgi:NTP pyrophosphatase (non-canonical NTP hydrolase)